LGWVDRSLNYARSGFLELNPRDYVFVHDSREQGLESDVFVAVQVDRYVIMCSSWTLLSSRVSGWLGDEMVESLQQTQNEIFGPVEDITQKKPVKSAGDTYEGGLLFERSARAVNVKDSPRAYSLALSYEIAKNMHSPAVGTKVDGNDVGHLEIRKKVINVRRFPSCLYLVDIFFFFFFFHDQTATACALKALKFAPAYIKEHLHQHGEALNVPYIGHPENNIFPNVQLNISPPLIIPDDEKKDPGE